VNDSRARKHDAGQATVEFALILPLVILLMVALVDVCMILRDQLLADALARDAARLASVVDDEDGARDAVEGVIQRSGRDDATWSISLDDDSVGVRVGLTPRSSPLLSSTMWFAGRHRVVGEASFAAEFRVAER